MYSPTAKVSRGGGINDGSKPSVCLTARYYKMGRQDPYIKEIKDEKTETENSEQC